MNTNRLARLGATLLGIALVGLATQASFAQNSFDDSIHRKPQSQSPAQANAKAPQSTNAKTPPSAASAGSSPMAPMTADPRFAKAAAAEAIDFGIAATQSLHQGEMHGPTPTQIPGGLVLTTEALDTLYKTQAGQFIVFDVLGGPRLLPGAQNAIGAAQAGNYNDQNQQQFGQYLQQLTSGNKQVPLVFYCQSVKCWMSYNAALRAINLGYKNVLWYRGGIEAWQAAGLQTTGSQGGQW